MPDIPSLTVDNQWVINRIAMRRLDKGLHRVELNNFQSVNVPYARLTDSVNR